jgi:hypothetical protein
MRILVSLIIMWVERLLADVVVVSLGKIGTLRLKGSVEPLPGVIESRRGGFGAVLS